MFTNFIVKEVRKITYIGIKKPSTKSSSSRLVSRQDEIKQIPIKKEHNNPEVESDDNRLRYFVEKKDEAARNLRRNQLENQRISHLHKHHSQNQGIKGITFDHKGNPIKMKKVNIEKLPKEEPGPVLKVQNAKKLKNDCISRDGYEQMLEDKNRKEISNIQKMVKMSMNIKDSDLENDEHLLHTFNSLVNKKQREIMKEKRAKIDRLNQKKDSVGSKVSMDLPKAQNDGQDESEDESDVISEMYNIEQIYNREQMNSQQRQFGSPDFVVANNSMMNVLPTDHLENVHPGVELIGGDKPLKGPKFNENPYFD